MRVFFIYFILLFAVYVTSISWAQAATLTDRHLIYTIEGVYTRNETRQTCDRLGNCDDIVCVDGLCQFAGGESRGYAFERPVPERDVAVTQVYHVASRQRVGERFSLVVDFVIPDLAADFTGVFTEYASPWSPYIAIRSHGIFPAGFFESRSLVVDLATGDLQLSYTGVDDFTDLAIRNGGGSLTIRGGAPELFFEFERDADLRLVSVEGLNVVTTPLPAAWATLLGALVLLRSMRRGSAPVRR